MATCSSILAWKIPWTEKPDRLQSMGLQKNWTQLSDSVQFSHVQLFVTPWTTACQANQSITNPWSLLKFMCIDSVMPSNHLILCCPLLLLPSIFPSMSLFQSVSSSHQEAKYWSFSFSISHSNEYSGLISFTFDWLEFLAVQGTHESLLPAFHMMYSAYKLNKQGDNIQP